MFARSIFIACALSAAPIASAQILDREALNPAQKEAVDDLMREIISEADARQIATGVKAGLMNSKESITLAPIAIDPSKDHVLIGSCSQQCLEFKLEAVDDRGATLSEVAKDNEDFLQIYDAPMLLLLAGRTGNTLRIKATMIDCADEPCLWGVGVFLKDEEQR